MMKNKFFFVGMIFVMFTLAACAKVQPEPTEAVGLPNPASVFCEQNGGKLEMRQDATGGTAGICVFSDTSECDEWAYFKSECKPGDSLNNTVVPQNESTSQDIKTGETAPVDAKGGYMPPGASEQISDWWGVIKSTGPGAEFDDYFERQDSGQVLYFGIDSFDTVIKAKIVELRDTGKVVHLYGTLFSNIPDYNGSQVQVDRIE